MGATRRRRPGRLLALRTAHPTRRAMGPRARRPGPQHLPRPRTPRLQPSHQRTTAGRRPTRAQRDQVVMHRGAFWLGGPDELTRSQALSLPEVRSCPHWSGSIRRVPAKSRKQKRDSRGRALKITYPKRGDATVNDLLAAFAASLSDGERRELARVLRTGHAAEAAEAARTARRRDGLPEYGGGVVRAVLAALGGQHRPLSGPVDDSWISLAEALNGAGVSGRSLRRWRSSGRVRWKPAQVHRDDLERELKRR